MPPGGRALNAGATTSVPEGGQRISIFAKSKTTTVAARNAIGMPRASENSPSHETYASSQAANNLAVMGDAMNGGGGRDPVGCF